MIILCAKVFLSLVLLYSNSLNVNSNPFVISSIGTFGIFGSFILSVLSTTVFINTALPLSYICQSTSWLALVFVISQADSFHGRVLSDSSEIKLLFSIVLAIWIINMLINIAFAIIYWKYARKKDDLHKNWTLQHK